jgi:hypothetical protein
MVWPCVARGYVDLAVGGLASMYPASDWSGSLLRAIMDISARSVSLPDRPRAGQTGHQVSITPGRPVLHFLVHSRRPRRVVLTPQFFVSITVSLFDPLRSPSLRPDPRFAQGVARRGCQGRPARRRRGILGASRPYLDSPEHDANVRRVGVSHRSSSLLQSRAPWRAPPRRCGRACWRARSPTRCDAGASWRPRSSS